MKHKIKCGWIKFSLSGILCDERIPTRLNGKCYKTLVRPVMCWTVDRTDRTEFECGKYENVKMDKW